MGSHDIIDNRQTKLVDHINRILESTEAARFAVGYFFLSGLESIADKLGSVGELRLLIGNTTNRETLEQIVEGHRRLDLAKAEAETQSYPRRVSMREMAQQTAANIQNTMELMDQTDEGENLIRILARMIEEKRLQVRVYTKGRLHAKAYIFDYKPDGRYEKGIAVVGSSNLTLAGLTHNTELNVVVHGEANHAELVKWFEELWDDSEDFDETLMHEMKKSWAMASVTPYEIYLKTLYTLVQDRLEDEDPREILWDDEITTKLADFQKSAVRQAVQIIREYGGAFVADVVGLGKSYVGAAILKHFERTEHARPLIICPAPLVDMWEGYNERYDLNARVLSMGYLKESDDTMLNILMDNIRYKDRDFLLLDESHNFRYPDTQRYRILQQFLATGKHCCFLTATPRNKTAWDVYHQIKLFHQDDKTYLPIDPPDLRHYFKLIETGDRKLQDLLGNILRRRKRNDVLKWYGYDAETHEKVDPSRFEEYKSGKRRAYVLVAGRHQFFPKRELETIEYSIEETYQGLYQQIRGFLGKSRQRVPRKPPENELIYARYGLWHYVAKEKQKREPYTSLHRAGANLRGLMRVLLFKRFESSVHAFRETVRRLHRTHQAFVKALEQSIVPAGEDAQAILYESDLYEEKDLLDAVRQVSQKYDAADFNIHLLQEHIEHDINIFKRILDLVEEITPDKDAKLITLKERLSQTPLSKGKRLVFTQYADTAQYVFDNLVENDEQGDIDVIYSGDKSKTRIVHRFSPRANDYELPDGETELNTVVATDVLAEGLNLQDCDKIINYDLHWNPVRLIQRFGRIDRIGSEHDTIYAYNFLPETGLEKNLGLREKLSHRIQEIHDTIGEDSEILDLSERLNETAMYAIYERDSGQLPLFEDQEDELIDLNEAEEFLRQLRKDNPEYYNQITSLRDGVRSAKKSKEHGTYIFCKAGNYQQMFLIDAEGELVSRDIQHALNKIQCQPETPTKQLPRRFNTTVMRILRLFSEEVKSRRAEQTYGYSLSRGQTYILREIRLAFSQTEDEDRKNQINTLERAFRGPITSALKKELNLLRRNAVSGDALVKTLGQLYHRHNMQAWQESRIARESELMVPQIICSEALI